MKSPQQQLEETLKKEFVEHPMASVETRLIAIITAAKAYALAIVGESDFQFHRSNPEYTGNKTHDEYHLFVRGHHDPDICPECVKPGSLRREIGK